MNAIKLYDKMTAPALAAWIITVALLVLFFRFGRNAISAVLMKLYEIFIGSRNHLMPY
jgi:hypothetical protein